jgi:hypothetical protein
MIVKGKKGGNLVDWEIVMKPKEKGGLGVLNLRLQNDALLMKHLHKFYNRVDVPWVHLIWSRYYTSKVPHAARESGSFWWKDVLRLNVIYRGITKCDLGDGSSICFWDDLWSDIVLSQTYPKLASFARNEGASVLEVMQAEDLESLFLLPLSQQAFEELESLQAQLQDLPYDVDASDRWTPIWGSHYTSRRFYSKVFKNMEAHPVFKVIWKSRCTPRVKFFALLILVDRLNTKNMLQRRNLHVQDDPICVMCDSGEEETIEHLLFECEFAKECWAAINIVWDISLPLLDTYSSPRDTLNPFLH